MGIFRRVSDILSANLNDLVDKFEDPEKMLKQALREMEQALGGATAAAAQAIASERLLAKDLTDHERQASDWRARAEQAVRAGDDELARHALRRKQEQEKLAQTLREQSAAAGETGQLLRRQVDAMKAKHAEARRKLAALTARGKAVRARRQWHNAGDDLMLRGDAFARFDRMRERVEFAEAETDALAELRHDPQLPDTERRDEELRIEAELAAIKVHCGAACGTSSLA